MYSRIFEPKSIAVIGASRRPGKVGHTIVRNLVRSGYSGKVIPVNPRAEQIESLPCIPEISALGEPVDLAVICLPAKQVADTIRQCAAKGIKAVIVISAGFKEIGKEGLALEQELISVCKMHNIDLVGPNCLGIINPVIGMNASFAGIMPPAGGIGMMSQSGALLAAILDMACQRSIGFSKLVSIGNKAVLDERAFLHAFYEDKDTKVIAAYLEGIDNGEDFVLLAERVSQSKPIVILKAGGTKAGAVAASSHTGSMAGAEAAYECAFSRSGIVRAESLEQLFDFMIGFANQPLPKGNRVAIVTNAGGPGIMAADACEREQLELAPLQESTIGLLGSKLPPAANVHNPIDVLGDASAEHYKLAMDAAVADENVDAILVLLTPQAMTDVVGTAETIAQVARDCTKPILSCFLGAEQVRNGVEILVKHGVPNYESVERAVCTIRAMSRYHQWLHRPPRIVKRFPVNRFKVERIIRMAVRKNQAEIGEENAMKIVQAYGFYVPRAGLARSVEQAVQIARAIGFPVALKIASPDILHKSDVGGVRLNINTETELTDAFELMLLRVGRRCPQARILGAYVQQMIQNGREVILGVTKDPQFGPMLMFGMGGVYVEVLKDVAFNLAPITYDEALQMLVGTKTYALLRGVRGERGVDVSVIVESLQRLSQLVTDFPQIEEMDINPLKVSQQGAWAVDARFKIALSFKEQLR